jgi:hypothetical protein
VENGAGMSGLIIEGGALAYVDSIQAPLFVLVRLVIFAFGLMWSGYERLILEKASIDKIVL